MTDTPTEANQSPRQPALAFVVGTGRCGSTVLGDLLATHPSVSTIHEYLTAVDPEPLPLEQMTGPEYAALVSRPHPVLTLLFRHRIEPREVRYQIDQPDARSTRITGLPSLLTAALPSITHHPDDAWAKLHAAITNWAPADGAGHYRRLASWFVAQTGATTIIERSGGSLRHAALLVRSFPEARFIHIHRAGVETALSMAAHPFFQLNALRRRVLKKTGHDPFDQSAGPASRAEMDRVAPGLTPWAFNVAKFQSQPPIQTNEFGLLWSTLLHSGIRTLRTLPKRQVLHIAHEDLCISTRSTLTAAARFLDLTPHPDWLTESATRVHPPATSEAAPDDRLVRTCAPGEAIRRTLTR